MHAAASVKATIIIFMFRLHLTSNRSSLAHQRGGRSACACQAVDAIRKRGKG